MDFGRVDQILEEERAYPTLSYRPNGSLETSKLLALLAQIASGPKSVVEEPQTFEFRSVNYELLSSLASQLEVKQRNSLAVHLLKRLGSLNVITKAKAAGFPTWMSYSSEVPLIGEFMIRAGYRQQFFDALANAKPLPGIMALLLELENFVAYNWHILNDGELAILSQSVASLSRTATGVYAEQNQLKTVWKLSGGNMHVSIAARDTKSACDRIVELCRKARYFVLRRDLLRGANLEVNQDKVAVESHLQRMGFSANLIESLKHADRLQLSDSPFDLKSSMAHLRSFVENLHVEACNRIVGGATAAPRKWGETVSYLRQANVLTKAEEGLVTGIYTLISDEAVHPLIAEREYARLSRNVVVEYGLLLLTKLDKANAYP
jgi:hypothetical protein